MRPQCTNFDGATQCFGVTPPCTPHQKSTPSFLGTLKENPTLTPNFDTIDFSKMNYNPTKFDSVLNKTLLATDTASRLEALPPFQTEIIPSHYEKSSETILQDTETRSILPVDTTQLFSTHFEAKRTPQTTTLTVQKTDEKTEFQHFHIKPNSNTTESFKKLTQDRVTKVVEPQLANFGRNTPTGTT